MNTIKLYQKNQYLKKCKAKLTDIIPSKTGFSFVLDKTIFFPTGGGQSCDKGIINNLEVINVYEKNGIVFHEVKCSNKNTNFSIGEDVSCEINWEHRFLNMQRHCGEHILSGIFYREYGGVNKGFHMGESYMTLDISLEKLPDIKSLTWDMMKKAEHLANQIIYLNAPITTQHFNTTQGTTNIPLRKPLKIDKDISIVFIGDINNPYDCVACCGTHPSTSGQVGLIKILKVENHKGMFRIYCEAGKKAMDIFDKYHEILIALNSKYSAHTNDLLEKILIQEKKSEVAKNNLHSLTQSIIKNRTTELLMDLEVLKSSRQNHFLIKEYEDMKIDDLLNIGRPLIPNLTNLLLIISRTNKTILLFSNGKIDCGKLVRDNASIYQGKGGGNSTNARVVFLKEESINIFIDLLDKHLR